MNKRKAISAFLAITMLATAVPLSSNYDTRLLSVPQAYALTNVSITQNPVNQIKSIGETAFFSVEAQGDGLTYQWQYKGPKSSNYANCGLTGNKTPTLSVQATEARNGYSYRCVITDSNNNQVISEPALLTVGEEQELSIISSPENQTKSVGETAYFSVTAEGSGLTYQWQYKGPKSSNYANCGLTGNKTPTLSVQATEARNGYSYRCVITDSNNNQVISEPALLTVGEEQELSIISSPENQTKSVGETAYFSVTAEGSGLTYQWQYKGPKSSNFANCSLTGNKTDTLIVQATEARNGMAYRCLVTDKSGVCMLK